jgi:hypothetical protein
MPKRFTLVAAVICLLALAATSVALGGGGFGVTPAAQSFAVGTGEFPDIAVDTAGTAHVVWNEDSGSASTSDTVHYCQVPRGATDCTSEQTFTPPLDTTGRTTYVFVPSAGRVVIESYRCCAAETVTGNYLLESTDGGQTFSAPRRIGNIDHQQGAAFGPGDAVSGARADASVEAYQRLPLSGAAAASTANLDSGIGIPTHAAVGIFGGTTPVQVFSDGDKTTFLRNTGGDPNSGSNWTGPTTLTPPGDEPLVASGPAGLVLLYKIGEPGARVLAARKFDGATFGAPVNVSEIGDPIQAGLSAEPSAGAFQALWVDNNASPNEMHWSSSPDGTTWSQPQTIVTGDEADAAAHLRVAAAPDGEGFGVWDALGSGTAIRVVPLKKGTPGSGDDGNDGSASNPADAVVVGDKEVTLLTPAKCVNPGVKITLRVTSKTKKKLSPKKRVKIVNVVFSLDKKKKKDKKAAFKATFKTAGLATGSVHKLRAKVLLKPVLGKGKKKTKTLKGKLTICG